MILFSSDLLVKINKEMFWSKDYRKTANINDFKLKGNSLKSNFQIDKSKIVKTNNRRQVGYDKFNKLGFYIMSIRYVRKQESHYVIINKARAKILNSGDKDEEVIVLKSCPTFIDIYIERLQKNDVRLQRIANSYELDYFKTHEFYYIQLVRNDGFGNRIEAENILPQGN